MPERLIKKYKNRRLYDTQISQYITIDDLLRYVNEGVLFHVVDSTTGKNLTNSTLLQIFVEMEATSDFLSPDLLRQLILLAQHPLSQSARDMFQQMMMGLNAQFKNNNYITEATAAWNEQAQQFFKKWPDFFS